MWVAPIHCASCPVPALVEAVMLTYSVTSAMERVFSAEDIAKVAIDRVLRINRSCADALAGLPKGESDAKS